jgi:hypothetical protein
MLYNIPLNTLSQFLDAEQKIFKLILSQCENSAYAGRIEGLNSGCFV